MIFVTVGLTYHGFERLIREIDEIAPEIGERVVAQIGSSSYVPENIEYFRETSIREAEKYFREARVVVSHGGIGSIITALKYAKPLVVVPRKIRFGEHNSDHQLDVAGVLEEEGKALVVRDIRTLRDAVSKVENPVDTGNNRSSLIEEIKKYIDDES